MIICALGACTQKLRLKGIDVLNPGKLKLAADVSVVCFDKTGTLTGSVVSFMLSYRMLLAYCGRILLSMSHGHHVTSITLHVTWTLARCSLHTLMLCISWTAV